MQFKHTLWADTETRSRNPITLGAYRYAEASECIMVQYALDDGPVKVWCPLWEPLPAGLDSYLLSPDVQLAFHNVEFDRTNMLAWGWGNRYNLDPRRFLCTMTWARMCRLPGGLEELCQVLGVPEQHSKKAGKALIDLFCVLRPDGKFTDAANHPDKWAEFVQYGVNDIVAMRECAKRMPQVFSDVERQLYAMTCEMNDRGVGIDRNLATMAMATAEELKAQYKKAGSKLAAKAAADRWDSDADIQAASELSITSQKAILEFLSSYGVKLEDARAATIERFLDTQQAELLPVEVRSLLSTRLKANKASVAKYKSVLQGSSPDDRIRGLINFYGAGTGRDAGRRFQPQNLARPVYVGEKYKDLTMDAAVDIVKSGLAEMHFDDPMQLLSDTVRGVLVPRAGNKFAQADLSSIEGRVLPWLAREEWMVQYFRDLDSKIVKYDGYQLAYATAFGVDPNTVTKAQRTLGKPIDLACLAGDTPVVTSNGIKPIIAVTKEDLLWDGTCWVEHQGVIQKGVRPTVNVDGISVTPDHLIETNGTWTQAGQLVSPSSIQTQALETGLASLRSLDSFGGLAAGFSTCLHNAIAERLSTKSTKQTYLKGRQLGVTYAQSKLLLQPAERSTTSTSAFCQTTPTAEGCLTESLLQSSDATTHLTKSFTPTEGAVLACTSHGEKTERLSLPTSLPLMDGTIPTLKSTEKMSMETTNPATCASSPEKQTLLTSEQCEECSSESLNSKPVFDILNAGSRNKFTVLTSSGALVVHNCGYGGGTGALITFATLYRIDINDMALKARDAADMSLWHECESSYEWYLEKKLTNDLPKFTWTGCQYIIKAWRNKRALTTQLWKNCETAFENAILHPGIYFEMANRTYAYSVNGWVFVQLPSGRALVYPHAHIADRGGRKQLAFMGVNPFTRKWGQIYTYGGKLTENIDQAVARDALFWSLPQAEAEGYSIVLRVHDELLTEVPDNYNYSGQRLARIMSQPHSWCPDLPLNAVGETLTRYQK